MGRSMLDRKPICGVAPPAQTRDPVTGVPLACTRFPGHRGDHIDEHLHLWWSQEAMPDPDASHEREEDVP